MAVLGQDRQGGVREERERRLIFAGSDSVSEVQSPANEKMSWGGTELGGRILSLAAWLREMTRWWREVEPLKSERENESS